MTRRVSRVDLLMTVERHPRIMIQEPKLARLIFLRLQVELIEYCPKFAQDAMQVKYTQK